MQETSAAQDERDRVLVGRHLGGDPSAAGELVGHYESRLFNVAFRMLGNVQDAEDVTQTVFGNAFRALESYDPKYRFFSWIYRMAVNESLNALGRRRQMVTLDHESDIPATNASGEGALEANDRVGKALMHLAPNDRAVVVLRHFGEFSYDEIATMLKLPSKTIKSRLFTARERLREILLAQQ